MTEPKRAIVDSSRIMLTLTREELDAVRVGLAEVVMANGLHARTALRLAKRLKGVK